MQVRHYVAWQRRDLRALIAQENKSVVHAFRGTGMTTALMEHIHEKYRGYVLLVTPSDALSTMFQRTYLSKYPKDFSPRIVRLADLEELKMGLRPNDRGESIVVVEHWNQFSDSDQELLARIGFTVAGNTSEMVH